MKTGARAFIMLMRTKDFKFHFRLNVSSWVSKRGTLLEFKASLRKHKKKTKQTSSVWELENNILII